MVKFLYHFSRELRPRQWLKNLALFAAILFTGQLFNFSLLSLTLKAFLIFCGLSSASYLFNDVIDAPSDRLHPFKKYRPIAAGNLNPNWALFFSFFLIIISLSFASQLSFSFFFVSLFFLFLQFSYSLIFKKIPVLDILLIAASYVLRVYAGEAATGFHLTVWLMLSVISLSLFLAIGKRRCELTLLEERETKPSQIRKVLGHYTEKLLDVYTAMFANSTWITYAFYTFLERPQIYWGRREPFFSFLPELGERKWLMATIPFVIYGIMRYMQIIYENPRGEAPERVLLSDWPILTTVTAWVLALVFIIYGA